MTIRHNANLTVDFNSIKVQLKQVYLRADDYIHKFQFHKGTIKTGCAPVAGAGILHFNSIKVQLKQHPYPNANTYELISIP